MLTGNGPRIFESVKLARSSPRRNHRSCLGDALCDLGIEAHQSIRRPVRHEPDKAGQPRAPRAEGERAEPARAHAGNDDGAGRRAIGSLGFYDLRQQEPERRNPREQRSSPIPRH